MIENFPSVRVYELLVKNASSGFAIHLLSLERYQCSQKKEGIFWTGVLQLDRKKGRDPWLLLATSRSYTLHFGISDDIMSVIVNRPGGSTQSMRFKFRGLPISYPVMNCAQNTDFLGMIDRTYFIIDLS